MTRNSDVFAIDPTGRTLPNDGVAAAGLPKTATEWAILEEELKQFISVGAYKEGLLSVLRSFLDNVGKDDRIQPAAWVSGFYGSGKSHFLRVLLYLWLNPVIGGQSARSLVNLPPEIKSLLVELDSIAKRAQATKFAASVGTWPSRNRMYVAVLTAVFEAARLPKRFAPAQVVMWLKEEGVWDAFLSSLERRDKGLKEVENRLFVSRDIDAALMEVLPGWASTADDANRKLRRQFEISDADVDEDLALEAIRQALDLVARESEYGERASTPVTLIIMDEVQQQIADDVEVAVHLQEFVTKLCRKFENRVLVVAAGQSALAANAVLARMKDRFSVNVQLQSKDVETVVREVVLRKRPEMTGEVQEVLDSVSGEVSRHLGGTKLASNPADVQFAVQDYPLLPTRRRFMEKALRAVDRGAAGQTRSQLRAILEAIGQPLGGREPLASMPLGNVIPADFVYFTKKVDMLNQGVLLHELSDQIDDLDDGTPEGELRSRAVQLIFLIEHLDESDGVRPTADTIADLLVTDLNAGSASLRAQLPAILDSTDLLLRDGEEYRLLSDEDREWNRAFVEKRKALEIDTSEQYHLRSEAITQRFEEDAKVIKVLQGVTNTPRKWSPSFGEQRPDESESDLTVWVRNGWETDESTVRATAAELGMDSPVVLVFIPREGDQEFKSAIADWRAAVHVVATQPSPTTEGGQRAKDAMSSRAKRGEERVRRLADTAVTRARVFLGGGEETGASGNLQSALREALEKSAVRKFPRFSEADHNGWPSVFKRAKEGNPDPLGAVGHVGEAGQHPVVAEVKRIIGDGQSGAKVVKDLGSAPYGWSKDAVLGAIAALVGGEELVASDAGRPLSVGDLTQANMTKATYRVATVVLTFAQRQKLKLLAQKTNVPLGRVDVPASLAFLKQEAAKSGGEPPLPAPPSTHDLDLLLGKDGPERDAPVADQVDALLTRLDEWRAIAERVPARIAEWNEAQRLLREAHQSPKADHYAATLNAIWDNRSLLEDPNPLTVVAAEMREDLRKAIREAYANAEEARRHAVADLKRDPRWAKLSKDEQDEFLIRHGLQSQEEPSLSDNTALIAALDKAGIEARRQVALAVVGHAQQAQEQVNAKFAPQAVSLSLPRRLICNDAELTQYLEELRYSVAEVLKAGKEVNIV